MVQQDSDVYLCVFRWCGTDSPRGSEGFWWFMWAQAERRDRERLHQCHSLSLFHTTCCILPQFVTSAVIVLLFCSLLSQSSSYDLDFDFNLEQEFVNNSGLYVFQRLDLKLTQRFIKFGCHFTTVKVQFICWMWTQAERGETVGENKALSPSEFHTCTA